MSRLAFALLLALSPCLQARVSEPPVRESIDLSAVTLNRLVLQAPVAREAGLMPHSKKQLPLSVQLYLRPSGQLNFLSRAVQKAAAKIRHQLAPGSSQKDRLRDSDLLAGAVRDWLDVSLPLDPGVGWQSKPATDRRLAWPRVSAILEHGSADADGRVMAAVALLRALKVPARVAWARGHLTAQYWVPLKAEPVKKRKKGAKKAPKPPLGWWALLDPSLHEAEVDAWSLDPGVLARVAWFPEQDLNAPAEGWTRAVFAEGDSVAARAAFEASLALGRITGTAGASLSLSRSAQDALQGLTRSSVTLWVLTVQRYELQSEGTMAGMDPIDILTPYRPHLASWGRELNGSVRELELEAQGLFSDRPLRLRLSNGKARDEWKSPPPALGVQHYVSFGLRRFGSVLEAKAEDGRIEGKLLRGDNLTPRKDWELHVTPMGASVSTQTLSTDENGRFGLTLTAAELSAPWVEISTPVEKGLLWNGDQQRVRLDEPQK